MITVQALQLSALQDAIYDDVQIVIDEVEGEIFLGDLRYNSKDVEKAFQCSRSTAWRILQAAVDCGMLLKHYEQGKLGKKCYYTPNENYEMWYVEAL